MEGLGFPGDFELAMLSKMDNNIKMMTLWTLNAIIVLHFGVEIEAHRKPGRTNGFMVNKFGNRCLRLYITKLLTYQFVYMSKL